MPQDINRRQALLLTALGTAASITNPLWGEESSREPTGKLQVKKVLFLGNSITLHGPAPDIGWTGNWGMAASSEEKDYVHLLFQQITAHTETPVQMMARNFAVFERGFDDFSLDEGLKAELEFGADLIVIALGENVSALTTDESKSRYAKAFSLLLARLKTCGSPTLLIRSCFWSDSAKDGIMKGACDDAGGVWVDMSTLGSDEKNFARSERQIDHAGVAGHPGDRGMQAIADGLWKAIVGHIPLWKPA